jgi:hypothetical protein
LENKKQFKCVWISSNLKEEKEIVLYPNRLVTVRAKGWIMYGMDSKLKFGNQLKNFRTSSSNPFSL